MATLHGSLADLSDADVTAAVKRLTVAERYATAALLRMLMEFDARRLYLGEGCASLFAYCTQVLGLAEGSAYNRIEAARAARRYPAILDALEWGRLTVTAVRLLAPHLTDANHASVLASAHQKSKREIEVLIASLRPQPTAPSLVRRLPQAAAPAAPASAKAASAMITPPVAEAEELPPVHLAPAIAALPLPRAAVTPLAPERYKVQFTMSRETHDKLRYAQDLLRHAVPSGDPAAIFDRALTLLVRGLERTRVAASSSPRHPRELQPGSRHVPNAVKRAVWKRDEGRCSFVGGNGRCLERGFLEFHHVEPYSAGGAATADNIALRCRAHNRHEWSLFVGRDEPDAVREARAPFTTEGPGRSLTSLDWCTITLRT